MKNITTKLIGLVLLLTIIVLTTLYFARKNHPVQMQEAEQKIPVVVSAVNTRTFERYIEVQANLESKNFAIVSPRIAGTIEKFFVDEGNTVIANETKLFSHRFSKPSANGRNSEKSAGCSHVHKTTGCCKP